MNKKIHAIVLLCFLNIAFVFSYPCVKFQFLEQGTNVPITNVDWMVWACGNSNCSTINPSYWSQSGNSGANNYAFIKFYPTLPPSGKYLVRMFAANHRSKGDISWNPASTTKLDPNACQQNPTWDANAIYYFNKKPNCAATFTPSIQSCAEAGLPLTILTDTQLNADTLSAFNLPSVYFPPAYNAWLTVNTKMDVDIKKSGSSASVSGFPTTSNAGIYAATTYNFNFLWQTSKNTEPGSYTVTMTSTVPDTKCDQSTMIPTTKTMTVNIAQSLDGCRAELQNFNAVSSGTGYLFTGKRLTEFQDWNYQSIDSCNLGNPTLASGSTYDTVYTLNIYNASNKQEVYMTAGTWTRATSYNTLIDFPPCFGQPDLRGATPP